MSPRALVYAAMAAVLLAVPGVAMAATVTATIAKNADGTVYAGAVVAVTCSTELASGGSLGNESYVSGTASVSGGTFTGGATSVSLPTAGATSLNVTVGSSGALALNCSATTDLSFRGVVTFPASSQASIVPAPVMNPIMASFTAPSGTVLAGSSNAVSAIYADPLQGTLTYAWTATGGTFANPAAASTTWTAPATQGSHTLTLTVTNSVGAAVKTSTVDVALSLYMGGLSAKLQYPRRVAATATGDLLVVDDTGALFLLTRRGDLRGSVSSLGATAVTVGVLDGKEVAFVATTGRGIIKFDPITGRQVGSIPWRGSSTISGLALDAARRVLWASMMEGKRAVAFSMRGDEQVMVITQAEGRALRDVADLALDAASNTLWLAERNAGLTTINLVHAFNPADGSYLRSMVIPGAAPGQLTDTGGMTIAGDGRVFLSDAFAGTVQVMSSTGTVIGTIGAKGNVDGLLLQPRGLAFMANGDSRSRTPGSTGSIVSALAPRSPPAQGTPTVTASLTRSTSCRTTRPTRWATPTATA